MSTPPIQYSGPAISSDVPWETRRHLQIIYQKLANHTQAFKLIPKTGGTTVSEIITGNAGSGGGSTSVTGIPVSNQSGLTSYTTQAGDNGALIVFSDASAIAVTLGTQTPPYGFYVANIGAGTATLTPAGGTISYAGNSGAASMPLSGGALAIVAFDGTNWWAATEAQTSPLGAIGFIINDGSTGTNVGPEMPVPLTKTGSFTQCRVVVKASDPTTDLTFAILKNGTSVFSVNPTVAHGTAPGTIFAPIGTLATSPVTAAVPDVFTINIIGGTSAWQFTAQLE